MLKICCMRPTAGLGTLMGYMGVVLAGRLMPCQGTVGLWFDSDWFRERAEKVLHKQGNG